MGESFPEAMKADSTRTNSLIFTSGLAQNGASQLPGRSLHQNTVRAVFLLSENQIRRNVRRFQEVSMSNSNARPRPVTVLATDDRASVVRRRETEAHVLRRDVMPEHLRRDRPTGKAEEVVERTIA
jgi:hypothetical protein